MKLHTLRNIVLGTVLSFYAVSSAEAAIPWQESYPQEPLQIVKQEGTLVFSDCPEYAAHRGILYEGTVKKGKGRIYYYHVNEIGEPARVVVYGKSDQKQTITVHRTLKGDASAAYLPTGRTLSQREILANKEESRTVSLAPKKKTILWDDDEKGIREEDLVSGIVEVEVKKPTTFGVAILADGSAEELDKELNQALPLPADSHEMRGTFARDLYVENKTWDFAQGPVNFNMGGDGSSLPFQKGTDEVSHVTRENTGDYGITYYITLHTQGEGTYRLYITALGGYYTGSFEIGQHPKFLRLYGPASAKSLHPFGEASGDYIDAGTYAMGRDLYIRYIPAGASYLPIAFTLVPENKR